MSTNDILEEHDNTPEAALKSGSEPGLEIPHIDDLTDRGTYYWELANYEPKEGTTDIYGIQDAMDLFEFQGNTNRCGQFAQLFVIEEFTGRDLDIDEFAAFAEANGWYREESGTPIEHMNKMLDYFGINNEMVHAESVEDLRAALANGDRVIVAIDAGEIWYGEEGILDVLNPFGADHAVEVIGMDETGQYVIVNDSGNPDGAGEMIPIDVFDNAWQDSERVMVVCHRS